MEMKIDKSNNKSVTRNIESKQENIPPPPTPIRDLQV